MNGYFDSEGILAELEGQPEDIRRLFIYAICQTMLQAGLLEFQGTSEIDGIGTVQAYRNPESGQVFEIMKPEMSYEDEELMRLHIKELLLEEQRQ